MRLIDADELRWTTLQDGFGRINTCIVFESDIDAMPTIEAIPIKWIETLANCCIEREKNNHFAYRGFGDYGDSLLELIDDWRKGNETD